MTAERAFPSLLPRPEGELAAFERWSGPKG
jgi:hypothetical protein